MPKRLRWLRRSRTQFPSFAVTRPPGEPDIPWTPSPIPEGLDLMSETRAARWVEESLSGQPWETVGSLLPDIFVSYVRIFHPAYIGDRADPVRWSAVAAQTGRTAHRLMQFERIAGLGDDPNEQPSWGQRPHEGSLDGSEQLAELLRGFTSTPERCWFCLWEGFGGIDMVPGMAEVPRVETPGRSYLLFHAPIDALESFSTSGPPWDHSPSIWWPQDRSWCVATDIDLDSTFVGGSEDCVQSILAYQELEAYPARPDDRVDVEADELNPR